MNIDCEDLLYHYENVVLTLHTCHKENAFLYKKISNIFSLLNIIFGTITGTSAISVYNTNKTMIQLLNIVFVYLITILAGCQKILEPSQKYERYRNASEQYMTLYYEIRYKKTFEFNTDEEKKIYVQELNIKMEDMRVKLPFINDKTYDMCKTKTLAKTLRKIETST